MTETIAPISKKILSALGCKQVWQVDKPLDARVSIQKYICCHKANAKFITPQNGAWDFIAKVEAQPKRLRFNLCKSSHAQVALVTMKKCSVFREGFRLQYKSFGNLMSITQACLEIWNRNLKTAKQKGSFQGAQNTISSPLRKLREMRAGENKIKIHWLLVERAQSKKIEIHTQNHTQRWRVSVSAMDVLQWKLCFCLHSRTTVLHLL